MISATIFEAKTNLSELVKQVQAGETVLITSGRERSPVARLVAVEPRRLKRLGVRATPGFELPASFWEPLTEEECGEGEDAPLTTTTGATK